MPRSQMHNPRPLERRVGLVDEATTPGTQGGSYFVIDFGDFPVLFNGIQKGTIKITVSINLQFQGTSQP